MVAIKCQLQCVKYQDGVLFRFYRAYWGLNKMDANMQKQFLCILFEFFVIICWFWFKYDIGLFVKIQLIIT